MTSIPVTIKDHRDYRRVEALVDDDDVAGFVQYEIGVDGTFDFFHAEVDDRFEGRGVGTQLAAGVVEFARSEGVRIRPTCSFLRSYLDQHPDDQDVIAARSSGAGHEPTQGTANEPAHEQRHEAELGSEADEPAEGEESEGTDAER
jgi:predicted GNAT family acetyltransferase